MSDCWRRRNVSSVSTGSANVGELSVLETSVGGVEEREMWELDEIVGDGPGMVSGQRLIVEVFETSDRVSEAISSSIFLVNQAYHWDLHHNLRKSE